MTTLIQKSKGLHLWAFAEKFDLKAQLLELKKELGQRGIRWSPTDLAALVEEASPQMSRVALGYMLDYLRPFSQGMGFRIARLSDTQVEVVIPDRLRNRADQGHLHEATLLPAALEAMNIFWQRHVDEAVHIRLLKENTLWHQSLVGSVRVTMEISGTQRELILSQIRQNSRQVVEMKFQVYDEREKLVAEIETQALLEKTPGLTNSSEK